MMMSSPGSKASSSFPVPSNMVANGNHHSRSEEETNNKYAEFLPRRGSGSGSGDAAKERGLPAPSSAVSTSTLSKRFSSKRSAALTSTDIERSASASPSLSSSCEDERFNWSARFHDILDRLSELKKQDGKNNKAFSTLGVDPRREELRLNEKLIRLEREFVYTSETWGRIIIEEAFFPHHKKTIKPIQSSMGFAGGEKYIVHGILFKFVHKIAYLYSTASNAMKASGNELRACAAVHALGLPGIFTPLMSLVDYKGFRLLAVSLLPLDKCTLVYGSNDGGKTVANTSVEFAEKICALGRALGLKAHSIKGAKLYTGVDCEAHYCKENGRYYLCDLARLFPPESPLQDDPAGTMHRIFRPNFVTNFAHPRNRPLSSDAFTSLGNPQRQDEDDGDVVMATTHLVGPIVGRLATLLKHRASEIAAKYPGEYSITHACHEAGINMRHLGPLWRRVSENLTMSRILVVEMCARALKCLIRQQCRVMLEARVGAPSADAALDVVRDILAKVFWRANESGDEEFWKELSALVNQKFFSRAEFPSDDDVSNLLSPTGLKNGILRLELFDRLEMMLGIEFFEEARDHVKASWGFTGKTRKTARPARTSSLVLRMTSAAGDRRNDAVDSNALLPFSFIKGLEKVVIKHLNILKHAEATVLRLRALLGNESSSGAVQGQHRDQRLLSRALLKLSLQRYNACRAAQHTYDPRLLIDVAETQYQLGISSIDDSEPEGEISKAMQEAQIALSQAESAYLEVAGVRSSTVEVAAKHVPWLFKKQLSIAQDETSKQVAKILYAGEWLGVKPQIGSPFSASQRIYACACVGANSAPVAYSFIGERKPFTLSVGRHKRTYVKEFGVRFPDESKWVWETLDMDVPRIAIAAVNEFAWNVHFRSYCIELQEYGCGSLEKLTSQIPVADAVHEDGRNACVLAAFSSPDDFLVGVALGAKCRCHVWIKKVEGNALFKSAECSFESDIVSLCGLLPISSTCFLVAALENGTVATMRVPFIEETFMRKDLVPVREPFDITHAGTVACDAASVRQCLGASSQQEMVCLTASSSGTVIISVKGKISVRLDCNGSGGGKIQCCRWVRPPCTCCLTTNLVNAQHDGVFALSRDGSSAVELWSMRHQACVRVLSGWNCSSVSSLVVRNGDLIAASSKGDICAWSNFPGHAVPTAEAQMLGGAGFMPASKKRSIKIGGLKSSRRRASTRAKKSLSAIKSRTKGVSRRIKEGIQKLRR